jgi:hypothetical protein
MDAVGVDDAIVIGGPRSATMAMLFAGLQLSKVVTGTDNSRGANSRRGVA